MGALSVRPLNPHWRRQRTNSPTSYVLYVGLDNLNLIIFIKTTYIQLKYECTMALPFPFPNIGESTASYNLNESVESPHGP